MNASLFRSSGLRVVGAISITFAILVAILLLARPEMMMTAMHRFMALIFVP